MLSVERPEVPASSHFARASTLTVPQRTVLALLRLYQLMFSPMFAGSCRFVPSCSAYAAEAVRTWGVGRGLWLAAARLMRCRPLAPHGFDPVPHRGSDH